MGVITVMSIVRMITHIMKMSIPIRRVPILITTITTVIRITQKPLLNGISRLSISF